MLVFGVYLWASANSAFRNGNGGAVASTGHLVWRRVEACRVLTFTMNRGFVNLKFNLNFIYNFLDIG